MILWNLLCLRNLVDFLKATSKNPLKPFEELLLGLGQQ